MADTLVITGGTLIDGTGAPARPNDGLVLSGDSIVGIGAQAVTDAEIAVGSPGAIERIDASGKTVMPGLIDAHTHLSFGEPTGNDELFFHRTQGYSSMLTAYNARKVLRAGVTSALDADCLWNIAVELRDAIDANIVEGPRMKAGGQALMTMLGGTAGRLVKDTGTTGYATVVENRDMMVNEIRRQIKHGVDWIKVMVTGLIPSMKGPEVKVWSYDELKTVCDTAHDLNTRVVAHCRNAVSTTEAARAGVDLIYHASYMDEESLDAILENGTMLCPTFTLLGNLADYGEKVGSAPELLDVFRAEIEVTAAMLAKAHANGVKMLTGSETGFAVTPVGEWHARELEMFVQYMGMSPLEAITCGTKNGAYAVRMEGEVGTLEAGMKADVLVVDGDPLADVGVLQRKDAFSEIISRGRRVDLVTPIPERTISSGEQVRFLASCPLTRSLALTEDQLERLSRV
jgi:imidazolonepropionase-like amidohydrolase